MGINGTAEGQEGKRPSPVWSSGLGGPSHPARGAETQSQGPDLRARPADILRRSFVLGHFLKPAFSPLFSKSDCCEGVNHILCTQGAKWQLPSWPASRWSTLQGCPRPWTPPLPAAVMGPTAPQPIRLAFPFREPAVPASAGDPNTSVPRGPLVPHSDTTPRPHRSSTPAGAVQPPHRQHPAYRRVRPRLPGPPPIRRHRPCRAPRPVRPGAHLRRWGEAAPAPVGSSSAPPCGPRAADGRAASARGSVRRGPPAGARPRFPAADPRGRRGAGTAVRGPAPGPTDAPDRQSEAEAEAGAGGAGPPGAVRVAGGGRARVEGERLLASALCSPGCSSGNTLRGFTCADSRPPWHFTSKAH